MSSKHKKTFQKLDCIIIDQDNKRYAPATKLFTHEGDAKIMYQGDMSAVCST